MLYCNRCGQCVFISDDNFIQYADISGSETRYINPENGDIVDYGDSDTETTGESNYECPYCRSEDIDPDSDITGEDALGQREVYEETRKTRLAAAEKESIVSKIKDSDWDLENNSYHK